jgi:hypothetical protein
MINIFFIFSVGLFILTGCKNESPTELLQEQSLLKRLQTAQKKHYRELVEQALKNNEDMSIQASDGTTVLHYLTNTEDNADLVDKIITKYPLLVKQENKEKISAMHLGSLKSTEYLSLFIKHGYQLDLIYNNNTLLYKLALLNNFSSIEKLLMYRGEAGIIDFLDTKNKPENKTAFQALCVDKYINQCQKLLEKLHEQQNYSEELRSKITKLKNSLNIALPQRSPAATKNLEEEKLAYWRELKSDLAAIKAKTVRERQKEEGIKKFLALDIADLELLLQQEWVWTSLLSDLKKELAPKLAPDALNMLVKTLQKNTLRIHITEVEKIISAFIDELDPHDHELLDKLEAVVFGARSSSQVSDSIDKKLRVFALKNNSPRIDALKTTLKAAGEKRQFDAQKTFEEKRDTNTHLFASINPDEIAKIITNNFRDPIFWSPLLAAPDFALQMPIASIEKLFELVVTPYKYDPLPAATGEPLVILSHVCRKLDPKDIKSFEQFFEAITKGIKNNPREILLKILKNKVASYTGASKRTYDSLLNTLNEKRIHNAKAVLSTGLESNKNYQNEAQNTEIQHASLKFHNASAQTSIDDQNDDEERVAGYVLSAPKSKLDLLWKQLSRKETGLILEHNIKQCLAWALAYLREDQMIASLETENFWKLISAYPEIIGFGLSANNLALLFNKLDDFEELKRRSDLCMLLAKIVEKLKKPKTQLHEALDAIEQAILNKPSARYIKAYIQKQRSLPANKR